MVLREHTHNAVVLCSKDNFLDLFVEVPDAEEIEVTEENFEKAFAWDEASVPYRNFASNASKRTTPEKRFSLSLCFCETLGQENLLLKDRGGHLVKCSYRTLVNQIQQNWYKTFQTRTRAAWYQAVRRWCTVGALENSEIPVITLVQNRS